MDQPGPNHRHSSIGIPIGAWNSQSGIHTGYRQNMDMTSRRVTTSELSFSSPSSYSNVSSPDGKFVFQSHTRSCMRRMENYLKSGILTDVTLIAGGKRVAAHRVVLSAASDYFDAMFTSDVREATETEIEIRQVDPDALQSLVYYCYTGSVELQEDNVEGLLATACLLQLSQVVEACCNFLVKQLHPSNCLGIKMFADAQSCTDLYRVAENYTMDHFMEVIKNQEFLSLPSSEVIKLFSNDYLNVPNEEAVFQALIIWLKYDMENRRQHLCSLLSLIKLPQLTPYFIADHIETDPLFRDEYGCQDLIREALMFHLLPERRYALQSPRTRPRKSTMGALYLIGWMESNKGANSLEKYSPRLNNWTQCSTMNGRRLQFGVAVVENRIFVVGGRDGLKTLASVECFEPSSATWTVLTPMTTHRHGLGVAVLGGPLYAVGGHDGWSFLNSVERWDPNSRQWNLVSSMNSPRSTAGVAVLNGRLYAVGGRDSSSCLRTVECYDPHTDRWTMVAPMNRKRGRVGVGVMNGCLYAFGGHDAPGTNPASVPYDCIERYDPATDTWTIVATMSVGRDGAGVCPLGEKIYVISGHDGQQCLTLVEAFDPLTNTIEPISGSADFYLHGTVPLLQDMVSQRWSTTPKNLGFMYDWLRSPASVVDADLCPEKTILAPFCSCYQFQEDGLPDLLCENIETVDQLVQIFNRSFPSNSLKSLTIEYSNLPELPANAFSDKTFERISIERSKIKSIDRHAFAGSKDVLQALMVASNQEMIKFPLDGLWGFEKLATIILSDLKIDSIRTLPSLPSLKKLAIQELRNLKVLSPLPYLPNLKNLRFVNTGIQKIENYCFEGLPALEKFDFDGNDLKVIKKGNFQFYSHVTELSFEENGIIEVEEGAFGGISDAVIVSLAQNNILALKESSFKPVLQAVAKNSGKVILLGNRLECFCDMKWLIGNTELSEALFEAKCAGKTDLTTLTKGYLDQVC